MVFICLVMFIDIVSGGVVRGTLIRATSVIYSATTKGEAVIAESGMLRTKASLARENTKLRNEVAQLLEDSAAYTVLKTENTGLTALVHLAQTKKGITAPVISSFHSSPYGTFVVGAGTKSGVSVGDIVLSADSFALGRISQVYDNSATVLQVFAPDSKIDIVVSGVAGEASGDGGDNAHADIPRNSRVKSGDAVFAASFSYPVGVVGSVASSTASATERLFIRVPVNLTGLQFVYVASNK